VCSGDVPCENGWAESLPSACPPGVAVPPNGKRLFRAVATFPPPESEFHSWHRLRPTGRVRISVCRDSACSLFDTAERCSTLHLLPGLSDRRYVVAIDLPQDSGGIQETGRDGHHAWWRCRSYDVSGNAVLVQSAE
jgi:hypothetical protein